MKFPWQSETPALKAKVNELEIAIKAASVDSNNSTLRSLALSAASGFGLGDMLHNIFTEFGYPPQLTFFNYLRMYERFGIAKAVVEIPPQRCWAADPIVTSDDESFNKALDAVIKKNGLWRRLRSVDIKQRVGAYGGLFMRVKDSKKLDQPIEGQLSGEGSLFEIRSLYESQLDITELNEDPISEEYGKPKFFIFAADPSTDDRNTPNSSFQIHPDRVIIISEDADDDGVVGTSSLEGPYNSLLDLRKILGSGGEGFYKNAAQSVIFELNDTTNFGKLKASLESFSERFDLFQRDRSRKGFFSPNLKPTVLKSELESPKDFAMASLWDVSASTGIPSSELIGEQSGKMAGEKDSESFAIAMNSRSNSHGTMMIRKTIDWMIKFGILPDADYEVEWQDLLAPSQDERLENAAKMAKTNLDQFKAGQDAVYSPEQIIETGGFDVEDLDDDLNDDLEDLDIDPKEPTDGD